MISERSNTLLALQWNIKNTHTFLIILFILGLFYSCSKSPKCWGNNKNKGIIESSVRIDCEPNTEQTEFIINSASTFQQTFTNLTTGQLKCTLPSIDFNICTLLGLYADGQCEVKFNREVSQNESEKNYHYKIIVKSCGACMKNAYSFNWVTVPKIPVGWGVTFEIINSTD